MPTAASVAPKPAAPKARTAPVSRAPAKTTPGPTLVKSSPKASAPALPAFARTALPASPTASATPTPQPRVMKHSAPKLVTAAARPKVVAIPLKGEGHLPGKPLSPHILAALENSFSIDLGAVRIHTDEAAQQTTGDLSARAFTYGTHIFLGKGESPDDMGLMAHEAAHIVQQQGISSVQMWSPSRSDPYEREADRASSAVQRGEAFNVRERVPAPRVQRFPGLGKILDYLADKAYNIPGYRMFTVIIGKNPINNEDVDRSAANVLRGAVEFIPGGHQITQVLDQYNVFEKVGSWVNEQIETVKGIAHSIVDAFWEFVHSLGISDVPHPIRTWERAEAIFSGPINQIINFIKGLAEGIWHFIRDAILKPIARLAEGAPGWDLLLAVLGKNPITGEKVASDADAVVGGFMKLIHQDELWANIKKANALTRIWAWFQTNIKQLLNFVAEIPSLFIDALRSLELSDIINLPRGFMKIVHVFGGFVGRFASWALDATWSLLQIIFEVVAPGAMPYLKKLGASFRTVLKNPIGFVGNLVRAAKLGFQQFANHIGAHLKNAFINWLTGSMPGVYIPASLEFGEIIKFVLSVLGLSWQNIRLKLVKLMGEPAVKAMETGFDLVVTLVREGPAAAWDKIKEYAGNLKDMAMNAIMDYIVVEVVKKAIAKVVSMFVPGGAFISAIISIYDTIVVFISKLSKMIQIATAFLDSMMEIASGAIGAAANKVEGTLEGLLSLAISFLAGFLGLGKIADKVMGIINTKIRAPIDSALDKVVEWIGASAKKLFTKFFGKKDKPDDRTDAQKQTDLDSAIHEAETLQQTPSITDKQVREGLLAIKQKYKMVSLELVVDSEDESQETVHAVGEINPKGATKKSKLAKIDPDTEYAVGEHPVAAPTGVKVAGQSHHVPFKVFRRWIGEILEIAGAALQKTGSAERGTAMKARGTEYKNDVEGVGLSAVWLSEKTHVDVHAHAKPGELDIDNEFAVKTDEGEISSRPMRSTIARSVHSAVVDQKTSTADDKKSRNKEIYEARAHRLPSLFRTVFDGLLETSVALVTRVKLKDDKFTAAIRKKAESTWSKHLKG